MKSRTAAAFVLCLLLASAAFAAPTTYRIAPGTGQQVRFEARTNTEK